MVKENDFDCLSCEKVIDYLVEMSKAHGLFIMNKLAKARENWLRGREGDPHSYS